MGTTARQLPSALEEFDRLLMLAAGRRFDLFLDYDGTLTPIVGRPELAILAEDTRTVLRELARRIPVALISGRDLDDLRRLVAIEEVHYAGSHGFEIQAADGKRLDAEPAAAYLPALERAEKELRRRLERVPGALVERKRYTLAVHYRLVEPQRHNEIEAAVAAAAAACPELRRTEGKKVFELQPAVEWNKGKALKRLADVLGLQRTSDFPLFLGDDRTDEDAFRELRDWGAGILVRDADVPTWAQFALDSPAEVNEFLHRLLAGLDRARGAAGADRGGPESRGRF